MEVLEPQNKSRGGYSLPMARVCSFLMLIMIHEVILLLRPQRGHILSHKITSDKSCRLGMRHDRQDCLVGGWASLGGPDLCVQKSSNAGRERI